MQYMPPTIKTPTIKNGNSVNIGRISSLRERFIHANNSFIVVILIVKEQVVDMMLCLNVVTYTCEYAITFSKSNVCARFV